MLRESLRKLAEGLNLSREEAFRSMNDIMDGRAGEADIANFLIGLREKGETPGEIAGCAQSMREHAVRIESRHRNVIDTCGTGGDRTGTFNVSTTAAIIASAAGVPVAKHGNKAVSSACGSADVLRALGVNIDIEPRQAQEILDDIGITFMFAPRFHMAMKHAAPVRAKIGGRTIFNILGPLTNPAGAKKQVIGVFDPVMVRTMAEVLDLLGCEHALVVHGEGGLDEFSTLGVTWGEELQSGSLRTFKLHVTDLGLKKVEKDDIIGGDAARNAAITRGILDGIPGAPADLAVLNAGAAIYVGGKAESVAKGVEKARSTLESGAAGKKLDEWIRATNNA